MLMMFAVPSEAHPKIIRGVVSTLWKVSASDYNPGQVAVPRWTIILLIQQKVSAQKRALELISTDHLNLWTRKLISPERK